MTLQTQHSAGAADARVVIGIDLGTTYSAAAVQTGHGPKVLRDPDGNGLIPSVVTPLAGGGLLVGREAKALSLDLPDRTIHSIKRLIGRSGQEVLDEARRLPYPVVVDERGLARVRIDGRLWSPEEISARILERVRDQAAAALGMPVRRAVITVPAYFDDAQRQATKDAAALAGLECLRIVNEPTAASLAAGIDGSKDGNVLVYDLGGGTFDVSVLRIQSGVFRVLATAGNTHLGGDDFDHALAERILAALAARQGPLRVANAYAMQAVRRSAEGLKIALSSQDSATLHLDLGNGEATEFTITRAEFEAMIAPWIDETMACVQRAVRDSGLAFADLDHVVLVGGSTRIPLVRRRIAELTGKTPNTEVDPDLSVALGAAIQADILAGGTRSLLLLDVIPLSLGIETMGGVVSKLILRNATIPASHTEEFSTQVDNQTAVAIHVYQGERELTKDCRKLGSFTLRGIPPMPAGLPRVAVTFLVDADGVLKVIAKEQRTGVEASIQVVPSHGLTREEVRLMMAESIAMAESDMAARESVELRNKAAAMVRGTRRALELAGSLPPDQVYSIKKALRQVEQELDAHPGPALPLDAVPGLREKVEELSRRTAQVADDVIGAAVKRALLEAP
ncbi:MAG: Fe-S protein assembly chaperone HscA [Planctomycetes bacterium]|nr:Fe-S protein assembly chaperone HscA [Planctomycetota bacterium]